MKWLFLVHRIQTPGSKERVRVWRWTRKVGALLYRNSVYVLPYSRERFEDFQWLCQQIRDSAGEASLFSATAADEGEDRILETLFNNAREAEYEALVAPLVSLSKRVKLAGEGAEFPEDQWRTLSKELAGFEKAFSEIQRIDFFGSGLQRKVKVMIDRIRGDSGSGTRTTLPRLKHHDPATFRRKTWATREHIHIDRLCSAWLIRKFIDPRATFVFAPESKLPKDAVPFDVFGVEFSHHGEDCTFETLLKSFRIRDKGLAALAQIVHDIDVKDGKFGRPEAAGLDAVVRSLSDTLNDDHEVLKVGTTILDSLYKRLSHAKRSS